MNASALRANCLDASALVKLYVNEPGSDTLKEYLTKQPTYYATPLCFYEALTVLKVMWLYRNQITKDEYFNLSFSMTAWFSSTSQQIKDIDFLSPSIFQNARRIAEQYSLDLSDAFQILSVKEGFFGKMAANSATVLVTADEKLAEVANNEGIRAWYLLGEPAP